MTDFKRVIEVLGCGGVDFILVGGVAATVHGAARDGVAGGGGVSNMHESSELARLTAILRDHLPALAERYRVRSLGVFGSYARGTQRGDSDLDLLVTFDEPPGLLRYIELENDLADLVGVRVDLVMQDALKPAIGKRVKREIVPV